MTDQTGIVWPTCDEDGCIGIRLGTTPKCLAHASDEERNAALKQLGETGEIDARGVPITRALIEQILVAAPHDADNRPTLRATRFVGATFHGGAEFYEATFQGDIQFSGATFHGNAGFGEVTFQDNAGFDGATFHGNAEFVEATFHDGAGFDGAIFHGDAGFNGATIHGGAGFYEVTFQGGAEFVGATFHGDAGFGGVTFHGNAWFDEVTFHGNAWFYGATFQRGAGFDGATFQRGAGFVGATFEQAREFGPLLAYRGLELDKVQFAQPVQIEASTIGVRCGGARFAGGVQFLLRWARVVLDDTDLAAPSILAGIPRLTSDNLAGREQRIAKAWQRLLAGEISERPRLLSLQRANVAGLGLSSVELADCRFAGAHNLDQLRLEADVSFAAAPVRLRWDWRQVIAEERAWRAQRSHRWPSPWWPTSALMGDEPVVLEAGQIAGLYRALRKGREDTKDEPGAADFYYGEMEMRRHARRDRTGEGSRGRVERGILTAYWLISGYGLRAWRALAWLAALTAAFAVAFHLIGFTSPPQPDSYWTSLLYAFRAIVSLTDPEVKLSEWGKLLQALLRITGPVLLGLALLAVRGRVKR
jgi:hypothetical protein